MFDGHNDTLARLHGDGAGDLALLADRPERHIDVPRARRGGLAAGMFALHTRSVDFDTEDSDRFDVPYAPPVAYDAAARETAALIALALRLEAAAGDTVAIVRRAAELDRCREDGRLGLVIHIEGAEAIDEDLDALDVLHAAGLRSVGPVWSRANAFGHGVPFRFPADPDTGPGLTPAGEGLVRRCNELGVLIDLSHMNAAGFRDVARLSEAPLVASHSAAHALCPSTRNLTDAQLREIGRSGGLVGIVFTPAFVRPDGRDDADTPLDVLVAHIRHVADLIGVDHVGLGSDFDGAPMPDALPDVAALPALLAALRDAGFSPAEVEAIAWGNWRRVIGHTWH